MCYLIWLVVLMAAVGLFSVQAGSTPIAPDLREVIQQRQTRTHYIPARAGWNGPEVSSAAAPANPAFQAYGPAASARAVRSALITATIPDPRLVVAVAVAIMLLRYAQNWRKERTLQAVSEPRDQGDIQKTA